MVAPRYSGGVERLTSEQTVAVQVQADALKEMIQVEDSVAAPFEHFEFIVESFDKTAAVEIDKVVGYLVPVAMQGLQESIEAGQAAGANLFLPSAQLAFGLVFSRGLVKNGRKLFA